MREFKEILESAGVKTVRLPARSPNLNSFAERFVRSIKGECLDRMILIGERSLRRAVDQFCRHYHHERNHQGLGNKIIDTSLIDMFSSKCFFRYSVTGARSR